MKYQDLEQTEEIDQYQELQDEELNQANELPKKETFKIFGLYDLSEVKIQDTGMRKYINLDSKIMIKSHGKIREKFSKGKVQILEIFANLIAVPGHRGKKHKIQTGWKTGKYSQNIKIVLDTLKIIEEKTKLNPVQVLITAIENAAPRDGITVIEYGGARYPQAVDISPLRRVTMTLKTIVHGSYDKSFNKKTKIEQALASEIIKAYNGDMDSFAMGKKRDSEKQADSAR